MPSKERTDTRQTVREGEGPAGGPGASLDGAVNTNGPIHGAQGTALDQGRTDETGGAILPVGFDAIAREAAIHGRAAGTRGTGRCSAEATFWARGGPQLTTRPAPGTAHDVAASTLQHLDDNGGAAPGGHSESRRQTRLVKETGSLRAAAHNGPGTPTHEVNSGAPRDHSSSRASLIARARQGAAAREQERLLAGLKQQGAHTNGALHKRAGWVEAFRPLIEAAFPGEDTTVNELLPHLRGTPKWAAMLGLTQRGVDGLYTGARTLPTVIAALSAVEIVRDKRVQLLKFMTTPPEGARGASEVRRRANMVQPGRHGHDGMDEFATLYADLKSAAKEAEKLVLAAIYYLHNTCSVPDLRWRRQDGGVNLVDLITGLDSASLVTKLVRSPSASVEEDGSRAQQLEESSGEADSPKTKGERDRAGSRYAARIGGGGRGPSASM